jgi:hypothetical protein
MERSYREASSVVKWDTRNGDLQSFVTEALGLAPADPAIWRGEVSQIEEALKEEPALASVGISCRYLPHRLALEVSLPTEIGDATLRRIKTMLGANSRVKERTVTRERSKVRINWVYAI